MFSSSEFGGEKSGSFDFIALKRNDGETFLFLYLDEYQAQLLEVFERYAQDPELSFSKLDAEVLTERVKKGHGERKDADTDHSHLSPSQEGFMPHQEGTFEPSKEWTPDVDHQNEDFAR